MAIRYSPAAFALGLGKGSVPMDVGRLIHVSVFPGWVAGVTYHQGLGYRCWVINPDLVVLNDGEVYPSSEAAIAAGRLFIHHSLGAEPDRGGRG